MDTGRKLNYRQVNLKWYNAGMNETVEYYELNGMKFILSPQKTIIRTPHQTFLVVPARHNYSKKMERLREHIRRGEMKSMTEIVSYCNLQPGRRGQMLGIELINTIYERHV